MASNRFGFQGYSLNYNSKEVARATHNFKTEVEMGMLRYFSKRISHSESNSSLPNVWEGDDRSIEHIKDTFPMPLKVGDDNSVSETDGSSSSANVTSKELEKSTSGKNNRSSSNSSSSSSHSSSHRKLKGYVGNNRIVFSSDEDDCVILEPRKEIIEIEDNSDVHDSDVNVTFPTDDSSHDETMQRLIKLKSDVNRARFKLRKTEGQFRKRANIKNTCFEMACLLKNLVNLTDRLSKAKVDIHDNAKYGQSYKRSCTVLHKVCVDFTNLRDNKKATLMKHKDAQLFSSQTLVENVVKLRLKGGKKS